MAMRSHRWKSPLEQAGRLRRITAGWLRGEGIPPGLYLPGDTDRRSAPGGHVGEIVVAEMIGRRARRKRSAFRADGP
jgi:hypothetical protein